MSCYTFPLDRYRLEARELGIDWKIEEGMED